jgi:fumarate hydratase class I
VRRASSGALDTTSPPIIRTVVPGRTSRLREESSPNDRFVALDLLPTRPSPPAGCCPCARTPGRRSCSARAARQVLTQGRDAEHLSRGIFEAYTSLNLRYSQMAPLTMWEEVNTGTDLPAQIELQAGDGDAYEFLFMAKGGGSANKSFLYQQTGAVLNPTR